MGFFKILEREISRMFSGPNTNHVQTQHANLQSQVSSQQIVKVAQKNEIQEVKTEQKELIKERDELGAELNELKEEMDGLNRDIDALSKYKAGPN